MTRKCIWQKSVSDSCFSSISICEPGKISVQQEPWRKTSSAYSRNDFGFQKRVPKTPTLGAYEWLLSPIPQYGESFQ